MGLTIGRKDFPKGFEFGVATAAYQIEGTSNGTVGPSHWDSFAATQGNVHRGQDGSVACDHYNRFEDDLDLVKDGGFDTYRFSTAWTRVMPDGRTPSAEGLDFYERLVDATLARGLKASLTLYHWELPETFADIGGWANRDTALAFGDYAAAVMDRLGDRVGAVATINEPWCVAWLSYFHGGMAPGMRNIRAAARAMHHINVAHGIGMQAIRDSGSNAQAGIVLNFAWPRDGDGSGAADRFDGIHNRWFIESITKGRYPGDTLTGLERHLPDGWQDDMAAIAQPIDWLGVNYYTRSTFRAAGTVWPDYEEVAGPLPKTDMGWEIYAQGLGDMLLRLSRDYTGDTPLIVTENGMAGDDALVNGTCDDPVRVQYFDDHLASVRRAIDGGAPIRGYYAWSLLDNYEWAFGYDKRFGIVFVDYDSQARVPKASYRALKAAIA